MDSPSPSPKVALLFASGVKFNLISCIPVDRSSLPQGPELDAVVVTDLYTLGTCDQCSQAVWIGPRQLAVYKTIEDVAVVACFLCSILISSWDGITREQLASGSLTVDLGGGHVVEGRPRVL